ncbi:MAG: acyl carrier protein [Actinomycetota bacterium]
MERTDAAPTAALTERLIDFIQSDVALHDEPIEGPTDLLMTGLVDSLGVVVIVDWLEDECDVTIDPADVVLDHFQTVDQMVAFVGTLR